MASLAALRKQAKDLGISASVIRAATTAEELQTVIDGQTGGTSKPVAKKKAATVAKKKTTAVRKSVAKKAPTRKPVRNSARKTSTPAKSRKSGTAKRSGTSSVKTSGYVAKGGRNTLDTVDYSVTDGWNPRPGSPPDRIVKSMKKFRGNRTKVYDALLPDVWEFVGKVKRDGSKRTKTEAAAMLAYRISRTAWDFAMRTGQHEAASNRVQYGTGGTGAGTWKPAKKANRKTAPAKRKTVARKSTTKTRTAQKAAQSRRKASTAKRKTTTRR